jgi:hypothetical protein
LASQAWRWVKTAGPNGWSNHENCRLCIIACVFVAHGCRSRRRNAARVLLHPYVDEQPSTRSRARVEVPQGVSEVMIRAHDLVHGNGPEVFRVQLGN